LAKLAKLEMYHGFFVAVIRAGDESLRILARSYHEDSEVAQEIRQIVAQARAEVQARSLACKEQQSLAIEQAVVREVDLQSLD